MLGRLRNSFAEIDLRALEHNYLALAGLLGPEGQRKMIPMVKADGYGHGDIQVARVCERLGARFLGVVLIEEGIKLRLAGIQAPILVFSHFDSVGAEAIVKYRLTPVLSQFEQIRKLHSVLHEHASYPIHLKFNTGMQRLGFEPGDALRLSAEFEHESYLKLEGICTHFAQAEDFGEPGGSAEGQIKLFAKITEDIKKKVKSPVLFHYLNSAGILAGLTPKLDLARPGLALYGAVPKLRGGQPTGLLPVMSVKSFVGFLHQVPKGGRVSYGGTWTASRDSTIAVIPIGYADGIPRALSNKGRVLIRGQSCPITGIICMDYLMVDVTELVEKGIGPTLGDEVVFIGKQQEKSIRAEEFAELAGTIPYEVMTGIQSRLARVYVH
jgi:alanine racemase